MFLLISTEITTKEGLKQIESQRYFIFFSRGSSIFLIRQGDHENTNKFQKFILGKKARGLRRT